MPFYRSPTLSSFQSLLNFAEEGAVGKIREWSYASVGTNRILWLPADSDKMSAQSLNEWNVFKEVDDQVQLRVISAEKLVFYEGGKGKKQTGCCKGGEKEGREWDTVVVYVHGGGFMGSSSHTSQAFTC